MELMELIDIIWSLVKIIVMLIGTFIVIAMMDAIPKTPIPTYKKSRKEKQIEKNSPTSEDIFQELKKRLAEIEAERLEKEKEKEKLRKFRNFKDDYMESRKWKQTRTKRKEIDNFKCQDCGETEPMELTVHHLTYKNIGKENMNDLITLCWDCHQERHNSYLPPLRTYDDYMNFIDDK